MTNVQVCEISAENKHSCKTHRSQFNACRVSKLLKFVSLLICDLSIVPKAPWPQGTECVARYNFKGTSEHDLPFSKGDLLTIIVVTKVRLHEGRDFFEIFHLRQFVKLLT